MLISLPQHEKTTRMCSHRMIDESEFSIQITNDIVSGDELLLKETLSTAIVLVMEDRYSTKTQRHSFKLRILALEGVASRRRGDTYHLKGNQLYPIAKSRKPWDDESVRDLLAAEKHQRGHHNKDALKRRKGQK